MCFAMEILSLVCALCLSLVLLLAPCAASDDEVMLQKSIEHGNHAVNDVKFVLPSLSRKFKLNDEKNVKNFGDKDLMPHKKLMEASSDNKQHKKEENVMRASTTAAKGTWREWIEAGPNKSEYFTMDYGWVRRRRPIHNKQIPLAP